MRRLYAERNSASFEILSISTDKNEQAWQKALTQEKNPWPQVWDNANIAASQFAVKAVPTTVLIDPEGKIVMREEGFDSSGNDPIEKKIRELGLL
jgi:peroxiredoxin